MVFYQRSKDCTRLLLIRIRKEDNKIRTHNYLKQYVCDT